MGYFEDFLKDLLLSILTTLMDTVLYPGAVAANFQTGPLPARQGCQIRESHYGVNTPYPRKAILIIINRTVKSERHEKHSITGRSTDDAGDSYTERKLAEHELVDAVDQKLGGGYAFSPPVAEIAPGRLPFSE